MIRNPMAWRWVGTAICLFVLAAPAARGEPYLAVQKGLKCSACHTSITGGGKRTSYGNTFMQTEFAARTLDMGKIWTGDFGPYIGVGGDLRYGWDRIAVPGQPAQANTDLDSLRAYLEVRPFPSYLTLYVDARLRPEDPVIRTQWARVMLPGGRWSLRAGEFFLPFGLRLQDDDAFIRQVSGINMNTPDTGFEFAYEQGHWSAQLAVTRGTAGGPEVDSGKQYSLRVSHVRQRWRIGGSLNLNDSRFGDRQMQNVFAGLTTGPVAWLAELDYIVDDGTPTGRRKMWASLIEANYRYRQGHNLKVTFEWFDPDDDVSEDEQNRLSVVWEYSPFQFLQTRIGYRDFNGIPQNPAQNREQAFAELHVMF